MRQIIKIEKSKIGITEVNSVNARDVHEYLEIKTKFSMWISRAIEKYDFIENVDYIKSELPLPKNEQRDLSGLQGKIEYIVTLDMAKELAMLENNVKGKETRKYFINFEKKAKEVIENQSSEIQFLQGMLHAISKMDNRVTKLESFIQTKRLENWQQKELQDLKSKKIYEIMKKHDLNPCDKDIIRKLHSGVWRIIKDKFNLPRYNELPILKFEEAKSLINRLTLKDLLSN